MLPTYKHILYVPVPGGSSPMENRFCPESAPYCTGCLIVPIRFWRMGHGRVVSALDTAVGDEGASEIPGSAIADWQPAHEEIRS